MANDSLLGEAGVTLEDVNGSDWEAMSAASTKLAGLSRNSFPYGPRPTESISSAKTVEPLSSTRPKSWRLSNGL